jgi:hypothetical protein
MFSSVSEVVIDRPTGVVFDYISHLENDPVWCPEVKRVKPLNNDPPGVGKTHEMMARPIPQNQEGGYEITQFDPPASMELKLWQGTSAGTTTYKLHDVDGGTRLIYETNVELSGVAKPFEPLVVWLTTRSRGPRMLANLKDIPESGADN